MMNWEYFPTFSVLQGSDQDISKGPSNEFHNFLTSNKVAMKFSKQWRLLVLVKTKKKKSLELWILTRANLPDPNHRARGGDFLGKQNSRITKYAFPFSPTNRSQSIRRNLKKSLNRKTHLRGQKNRSYLIQSFYDFIIIFVVINAASHNVLDSFILKTRTTIWKFFFFHFLHFCSKYFHFHITFINA